MPAEQVYSTPVGEPVEGESQALRYYETADRILTTPTEEVTTVYELLKYSASKRPNLRAVGTRPLVKVHVEEKDVTNLQGVTEKKKWTYLELGPYVWKTYKEFYELCEKVGTALTTEELGSLTAGSRFGIYAETCEQWLTLASGCFSQGITVATIYANLGEEGVVYSLNDTALSHILTDGSLLPSILKTLDKLPLLKYIIYTDHREPAAEASISALEGKGIKVFSFTQFLTIAMALESKPNPPKPQDVAVIMYTSGTTGVPKGVMITHANIVASVAAGSLVVLSKFSVPMEGAVYCSFLPLAHILELVIEHIILFNGGELAYGSARTMTDNLVKDCRGDLGESKPHLMAGVPVLWERIRKGALEKIKTAGGLKAKLFNWAFNYKLKIVNGGSPHAPIVDKLIFSKFQEIIGGRVVGIVSGGAPLSHSTHQFLRVIFNCPVIQGYGLTETTGLLTAQPMHHMGTEIVGAPFPCAEVKLVDVPEMGYTHKDVPLPRGEIWARGAGITLGYYNQPEKTKEEFKEGGWFATGDIAQLNKDGTLSIVDRKKNLVKLSHGEYIALEAMEAKYKQDPFVDDICIVANSQRDLPAAIVVPNKKNLTEWAVANGFDASTEWEVLVKDPKVVEAVKKSLLATATKEKMKAYEKPAGVYLVEEEWTVDSGMVTAAMKLKRQDVQKKYKQAIDEKLFPPLN
ncbi:hypothetical protein PROFUN_05957 [Planoprotostelium fungivorum]|uniref:AMP-dependent synthetase/ligase domain-containing protein n=1 Tax=Planoprotostelium fungivorum TaxID=1890364 RepID=A0A2P6N7Q9_9EUKA|nr:hypothetical protein PROFUN_05957 [Planoprotostelium fungivorum]